MALERIKALEHQVAQNAAKLDAANKANVKLLSNLYGHEMKSFSYVFLEYLSWLTMKKFDMLIKLVKPYIHLISFPNSKVLKTFNTQLLSSLAICRHGLHLKFISFIIDTSDECPKNFQWLGNFIATVFNRLDLIDSCWWVSVAQNAERVYYSVTYPESISYSEVTEKSMLLEFVEQGFAIQDLCAEKGVFLNRPKQKDCEQFTESEVQRNIDIATTRIHVPLGVWEIGGFWITFVNTTWVSETLFIEHFS